MKRTKRYIVIRNRLVNLCLLSFALLTQEQLTRSILPPHFTAKIKKDFQDIFKFIEEHKKPPMHLKEASQRYCYFFGR